MQEADVAHEGKVSELISTIQHGADQLKQKEDEIKKLMKSAEDKDEKIQALQEALAMWTTAVQSAVAGVTQCLLRRNRRERRFFACSASG